MRMCQKERVVKQLYKIVHNKYSVHFYNAMNFVT